MTGSSDIVDLGYAVDTAQVLLGDKALDQLTVSTLNADKASKVLAQTSLKSGQVIKRSYSFAKTDLDNLAKSTRANITATGDLVREQLRVSRGMQNSSNQADKLGGSMRGSAGHTANLFAQFNDIGVMLASGQSPLILAAQQGTQVNQVLAQMGGGRRALRGLGAAALTMVNPINLATIAVIAIGAAVGQMAISALGASRESKTLEDQLDELAETTERYSSAADLAGLSTEELDKKFGGASIQLRGTLDLLNQIAANQAQRVIDQTATALSKIDPDEGFNATFGMILTLDRDLKRVQREARNTAESLKAEFKSAQAELAAAEGDTQAQVTALERLQQVGIRLADISGERSAIEDENLKAIADALTKAREKLRVDQGSNSERQAELKAARDLSEIERKLGESLQESVRQRERETTEAGELLQKMEQQNAVLALSAKFGSDSAAVTRLRAEQERQAFVQMLNTKNISQELKDRLLAAFDTAQDFAAVDMEAGVDAAAEAAARLADRLGISLEAARSLSNLTPQQAFDRDNKVFSGRGGDPRGQVTTLGGDGIQKIIDDFNGVNRQRDARNFRNDLDGLVESLETERQALERWYAESQMLLEDRRATELLTEQEHREALAALDREYHAQKDELARNSAQVEVEARSNALNAIGGLLGAFAGQSRAAAVAQIAINKGLSIAQAIQNTAVAQTRALAELGPIAGPPMAARIGAWGKVQIAAIAATGLAQAANAGGGGSVGGAGATGVSAAPSGPSEAPRRLLIDFQGDDFLKALVDPILEQLQDASREGAIIIEAPA